MRRTTLTAAAGAALLSAAGCGPGRPAAPLPTRRASEPLPVACDGAGQRVRERHPIRIGRRTGTVLVVACDAGAGSPPDAVLVYDGAPGSSALVGQLVRFADDELVTAVAVAPDRLTVRGFLYSGADVPRCCPDREVVDTWALAGTAARRTGHLVRDRPAATTG